MGKKREPVEDQTASSTINEIKIKPGQKEDAAQDIFSAGNPCHRFNIYWMDAEQQRRKRGIKSVASQQHNKRVNKYHIDDMQQQVVKVEPKIIFAPEGIIDAQAENYQRMIESHLRAGKHTRNICRT